MASSVIQQGHIENDYIEYKKSAVFKAKILKTACAYANNFMNKEIGLIFIGIEEIDVQQTGEKAYPVRPITGVEERMIETTENALKKLLSEIHPRINYHLIIDKIDERYYIILAVEPGRYIRLKRNTRLPNAREEFELLKKFANYTFSSGLNETATIDDLNYEYMKEYLIATHAKQDIRALSKLEMARSMGLISESEYGGYRAKNFAVLMFADKPQEFIPYARVEIIREVIGTEKMESKIFDGPVWILARQVFQYFMDNIMSSYTIRDNGQIGHRIVYNWPQEMFFALDLIESYGSGIRRAKDAMDRNGSPKLIFEPLEDKGDYTMVTAYISKEFAAIQNIESKNIDETKEMTKEINLKMKLLIKENPAINANEIAKALNISPESVRYRIKAMKKTGEIQRKGSTKKGEWIITEMVTPQNTKF